MKQKMAWVMVAAALAWLVPAAALAGQSGNPNDPWCREDGQGTRARYCEVRESTHVPTGGLLSIDAAPNGGIKVIGWARREVLVRAKVVATADTEADAQALARQITVQADGPIRSSGPSSQGTRNWSVSFEVSMPFDQAVSTSTVNGGVSLAGMRSGVDVRTVNGGIDLSDVSGRVHGQTQNGGVSVSLQGQRWDGEGLDLLTHNGGVTLSVPDGYSAHLDVATVNGRVRCVFPMMATGDGRTSLEGDLNGGGTTLKLRTTNGGVSVTKNAK